MIVSSRYLKLHHQYHDPPGAVTWKDIAL